MHRPTNMGVTPGMVRGFAIPHYEVRGCQCIPVPRSWQNVRNFIHLAKCMPIFSYSLSAARPQTHYQGSTPLRTPTFGYTVTPRVWIRPFLDADYHQRECLYMDETSKIIELMFESRFWFWFLLEEIVHRRLGSRTSRLELGLLLSLLLLFRQKRQCAIVKYNILSM